MRTIARVLSLAAFAPLAAGWWALAQSPGTAPVLLPDGAHLRLRGVSYATEHRFPGGAYWQLLLDPVLPESLRAGELGSVRTSEPSLGCLFMLEEAVPGVTHRARLAAHDLHGCRIGKGVDLALGLPPDARAPEEGRSLPPHPVPAALTEFPRRAPEVRLRLLGPAGVDPVAEFKAAGLEPVSFSEWTPVPLPASAGHENVRLTVTSLSAGFAWEQLRAEADPLLRERMGQFERAAGPAGERGEAGVRPEQADWTLAEFRVTHRGAPTARWQPHRVELADATGNRVRFESPLPVSAEGMLRGQRADGTGFLAFPTPLCVEEPAWRLRAVLGSSGNDDSFADADFRWTERRVPVPARKEETYLFGERAFQGVRLRLDSLLGEGAAYPESPEWDVDRPCIRVHAVPPPGESVRLSLRAVDDRGRTVFCPFRGGPTPDEPEGWWYWQMEIPEDARWLDLRFAGWRSRAMELTVRPRGVGNALARRSVE